jgi:hypothetical protein
VSAIDGKDNNAVTVSGSNGVTGERYMIMSGKTGLPGQHNVVMCQAQLDGLDNIMPTEHGILATRKIKRIKLQL